MTRLAALAATLVLLAGCAQKPADVARMMEGELSAFGLDVDADRLSPGQTGALGAVMSSDRSNSDKRLLLRSLLAHPNRLGGGGLF